jgi:uncharacterized protein YjbI with pentapeptide repeats
MKRKLYEFLETLRQIRILGKKYFSIRFKKYNNNREEKNKIWKILLYIIIIIIVIVFIGIILYICYNIKALGFTDYYTPDGVFTRGKTLWDWLGLLIVPILLTVLAISVSDTLKKREIEIGRLDNQNKVIQDYHLLVTKIIEQYDIKIISGPSKSLLRARTLAIISIINKKQKAALMQFIVEAGLLQHNNLFLDLESFDLSGISWLPGNYEYINLNGTNMSNSFIQNCSFRESKLSSALLCNSILYEVAFTNSDLCYTDLSNTKITKGIFIGARLIESKLMDSIIEESDFVGAIFRDANLRGAKILGTKLLKAIFTNADLSFTNLSKSDLSGADLNGANLYGAKLDGAILRDTILDKANISERQLSKVIR